MSRLIKTCAAALAAAAAVALAPVAALAETVAVVNARIFTLGPAGEIPSGAVVIRDGRIAAVGANVAIPADARVIDAGGRIVTPGFLAADSALGVVEISGLGNDLGVNNAGLSAAFDVSYGLNPRSITLAPARLGGITRAVVTPVVRGGGGAHDHDHDFAGAHGGDHAAPSLFAGQAAAVHLGQDADMLVRPRVAMRVQLGQDGARIAGGARGATFVALKAMLDDVRHYQRNRQNYDRGGTREYGLSRADLEALIPVVEGRMPLIMEVHRVADIRQALRFAREQRLTVILSGVEEGWLMADEIAAARVPVMVNPLSNLPRSFETLGSSLENAARLHAAGVPLIIVANEGAAHRARELRYNAGNAVAHGLPYEAALRAISATPARVFGIGDRYGTLEVGKDADLVIWSGDPLEPMSQPQAVFVRGRAQPMTSRGIELARRYLRPQGETPPAYR